jgi:hypothetical protein
MRPVFRVTLPEDLPRLVSFLAKSFSADPQSEFLRPDLLHWKLWTSRDDYHGPRSYVLEKDGEIVAHSGVWPTQVQTDAGVLQGCHMFDWASDAKVLGAGVSLLRRLSEIFDFLYANGGSDMTRRIIPDIGFQKIGDAWLAARPLRPVRQAFAHRPFDWKTPARLARNTLRSLAPSATSLAGWSLREGIGEEEIAPPPTHKTPPSTRSNGFFRYLEKCPTAKIRVWEILKDGLPVGRLVLSLVQNQLRIAGVWLLDPSPEARRAAYALALDAGKAIALAFEAVSVGSTRESESAASDAGLKVRDRTPVLWMPGKSTAPPTAFEFQMADNDSIYLP